MNIESLPDLSARQLRAVLAVAEYRSFIAASAFLKISQPALTRRIKQLESELGVELFTRTTRQVGITAAGREFTVLAQRLLTDLQMSVSALRAKTAQPIGPITVSSVISLAGAVMPDLIATFGKRYPGIQVHLREGIQGDVVEDVRAGVADFAIAFVDTPSADIEVEPIRKERFHVVMASDHSLAHLKRIPIDALRDMPMVSFGSESRSRRIADDAAARRGLALRYAMTANRLPTLLSLVRKGVGAAIVPSGELPMPSDRRLIARPLIGAEFSTRLGVLRSKDRKLSAAAAIFFVVVRRWLKASTQ